ncbi:MAG: hypothetical protein IJU27_02450 [Bacteroidales bacterium]|nr:hypothetical protein [Bacteroidales bacterium]
MKKLSIILMCATALAIVSCGGSSNAKGNGKPADIKTSVATSDAVDLGLSVKWAKANLGAKDASDPGNYYAWGETKSKKDFNGATYIFKDGTKFKKYTVEDSETSSGAADKLIVLEPGDDAATAALGKGWRMPTRAEAMELFTKCKFSYDKPGLITVTGPNGNSIDFPKATGYYYGTEQQEERYTWLWTASMALQVGTPVGSEDALEWHDRRRADAMRFGHTDCYAVYRENGLPIRPVKD